MLPRLIKMLCVMTLISIYIFNTTIAIAQTNPSQFQITSQDLSDFPNNTVQFSAYNFSGFPIADLSKTDIAVFDNQVPVEFELSEIEVGVRVVFLIDSGMGINGKGATGKTRYEEMKEFIKYFTSRMGINDSVMVLSNENNQDNLICDFGSSTDKINEQLEFYQPNPSTYTDAIAATIRVASNLTNVNDEKKEFIFLLTSGLESYKRSSIDVGLDLLNQENHPIISSVLFRTEEGGHQLPLTEITKIGGGQFLYYTNDSKNLLDSLFSPIFRWQNQYEITYRIPDPTTGSHEITIVNASNTISASSNYSLGISEPTVQIVEPINNQVFKQSSTELANIVVKVDFSDGYNRKIKTVGLYADNQLVATINNPEGTSVNIPWDYATNRILKTTPVQLEVEVIDEVDMVARSNPVQISLEPANLTGASVKPLSISFGMQIGALALAIAAVILVIVFRRSLSSAGGSVAQKAGDVWDSITKPRRNLIAKAYIQVIAGLDDETTYELYGTTPIGRSKRNAELIFQGNEENSLLSRLHCTILDEDDVFYIRDEDSQWGTFLNNRKLDSLERYQLHENDEITLAPLERGGIRLRFTLHPPLNGSAKKTDEDGFEIEEIIDGDITKTTRRINN